MFVDPTLVPTEPAMPPSPATPRARHADRSDRPWRQAIAVTTLCLLAISNALYAPGARAQGMPPAVNPPTDPFHQPCVEIRDGTNRGAAASARLLRSAAADRSPHALKRYVDLDDRCANLPEFAPTRDTDTTSVWYVSMPVDAAHGTHGGTDVHSAHATSPQASLPMVAS